MPTATINPRDPIETHTQWLVTIVTGRARNAVRIIVTNVYMHVGNILFVYFFVQTTHKIQRKMSADDHHVSAFRYAGIGSNKTLILAASPEADAVAKTTYKPR